MVTFVHLPCDDQQFAVVNQPRVPGGPEGIASRRGIVRLPQPGIGLLQALPGGKVAVHDLPSKDPGMPEQMVNPGLVPFPQRVRRVYAITIEQVVRMQRRETPTPRRTVRT